MAKVLVIRFSSIGDIVLTTPVVRCLKLQLGNAEIHYLTKTENAQILSANPYIDKLFFLKGSVLATVNELRNHHYDYVIDLHHNQRSGLIKVLLGVTSFSFPKLNFQKWLMVNFKINHLSNVHIVDRYFETVKTLGVKNDGLGLDFFMLSENENSFTLPKSYIAWAIGAKQTTKQYPAHKIAEAIASALFPNIQVVLLGGKEDMAKANQIIQMLPNKPVVSFVGKCNLQQSAALVKHAKILVTNDTGLMHIGAALQKPIVSIWGNTVPAFGMTPYYGATQTSTKTIEVDHLACRPCSKLGYSSCPKQHFRCMEEIETGRLVAALQQLIS